MEHLHLGLFEGIGGFSLAAREAGFKTVAVVEKDKFCQKVLAKNFKNAKQYSDIKDFDGTPYRGTITVITGGFPCQPYSTAGKRKGNNDDRALWSEMFRIIREVKPPFVVGENVRGILSMDNGEVLEDIFTDLESEGYAVQAFNIPACAVEAPHRRERIWIVAQNTNSPVNGVLQTCGDKSEFGNIGTTIQVRTSSNTSSRIKCEHNRKQEEGQTQKFGKGIGNRITANPSIKRQQGQRQHRRPVHTEQNSKGKINRTVNKNQFKKEWYEVASKFCRVDDGLSQRLDKNRRNQLKALGNAIVPQVAIPILKAIKSLISNTKINTQP